MASSRSGSVMGLDIILFIVFLVLKLTNAIDWSWWWVAAPIWIPIVLGVFGFILAEIIKS
jgi:hypothetical protein